MSSDVLSIELRELKPREEEENLSDEGSEEELLGERPLNSGGRASKGAKQASSGLRREINVIGGVGLIVGQIIGTGIFITPRTILCETGSFGVTMIVWVAGAVIALCGAICFIELGIAVKKSGGDYAYLLEAYSYKNRYKWTKFTGSLIAFLFSWMTMFVVKPGGLAVSMLTCASYLMQPLYIECEAPRHIITLVALIGILFLGIVNSYSVKLVTGFAAVVSFLKVLACVFVIAVGVVYLAIHRSFPEDLHKPFKPIANHAPSVTSVALALYYVLFTYDGWNVLNYAIEETKRPERTLPLSMFIAVSLVAVCYLLVNVAFFSVLTYDEFVASDTVGLAFGQAAIGKVPGLIIISLLVAMSTFGSTNAGIFSGARVAFATARDGLLPDVFSGVQQSLKTPVPSLLLLVVTTSVYVCIGDVGILIEGVSAIAWLFYFLIFCGILILRVTHPELPRPYKAWVVVPVTLFMILVSGMLVVVPLVQEPLPSLVAFSVLLLGVPVYVFLVMDQPCRLRPRAIDRFTERVTKWTNSLLNTKSTR